MDQQSSIGSGSSNHWAALSEQKKKQKYSGGSKFITPKEWTHNESHILTFNGWKPHTSQFGDTVKDSAWITVTEIDGVAVEKVFTPYGRQLEALLPTLAEYLPVQHVKVKFTKIEGSTPKETTYTANVHGAVND